MDSKIRRITVFCAFLMVLLILGTVVGINVWKNQEMLAGVFSQEQVSAVTESPTQQETDEAAIDYSAFLGMRHFSTRISRIMKN